MRTFIKRDVVDRVIESTGERPERVTAVVNRMFHTLRTMLSRDDLELRIEIRDFGVFEVRPTKSKPRARNPKTNEVIFVPARRKAHFKPGKLLRNALKAPVEETHAR
ncbi:MAG: DNA-binding protein HU [Calditrichaeota bacterium]|nr:DNA-binding protein HU [Calditrichota bacterium]